MAAQVQPLFPKPTAVARRGAAERAFLPAALEIVDSPPSPTLRLTAGLIGLALLTAFAWSWFGWVDIVATAPGKVIARARTKVIQSYETGVVRAIKVADGELVREGQVLIELDPTLPAADRVRFASNLIDAQLDQARLRALLTPAGDPFVAIRAAPELLAAARARLEAERRQQSAKLAKLDQQVAQKRADRAAIGAQIGKIDAMLPLARDRAAIRQDTMNMQYGSKLSFLEAKQQVIEMEHERVVQFSRRDEADAAIVALAEERAGVDAEFKRGVLTDLAKVSREIAEMTGELAKAAQRTSLLTLTAPVDGVVQDLAVHTLGGVVAPGQQLLRIVPSGGGIEVEAVIGNQDVGFLGVGQSVEIKVDTFPFTRYGLLQGRVREIARDAVSDPQQADQQRRQGTQSAGDETASVARSHALVYTARITLDETRLMLDGNSYEAAPGMSVVAEINTGRRRVLDFLLSPLSKYSHDVFRER